MSVHASVLRLPVAELPLDYGRRPEGSHSKLSTFKDGARILWMFAMLMKETRPFMFFGYLSVFTLALSMLFMVPVLNEYFLTGLVTRMPTWVFAIALMMMALMIFSGGLILDSLARSRFEQKRFHYMSISPSRDERRGLAGPGRRATEEPNIKIVTKTAEKPRSRKTV
jgi:hypothetical protein